MFLMDRIQKCKMKQNADALFYSIQRFPFHYIVGQQLLVIKLYSKMKEPVCTQVKIDIKKKIDMMKTGEVHLFNTLKKKSVLKVFYVLTGFLLKIDF